jgi:hypothetical protein
MSLYLAGLDYQVTLSNSSPRMPALPAQFVLAMTPVEEPSAHDWDRENGMNLGGSCSAWNVPAANPVAARERLNQRSPRKYAGPIPRRRRNHG